MKLCSRAVPFSDARIVSQLIRESCTAQNPRPSLFPLNQGSQGSGLCFTLDWSSLWMARPPRCVAHAQANQLLPVVITPTQARSDAAALSLCPQTWTYAGTDVSLAWHWLLEKPCFGGSCPGALALPKDRGRCPFLIPDPSPTTAYFPQPTPQHIPHT